MIHGKPDRLRAGILPLLCLVAFPLFYQEFNNDRIVNPPSPPASMDEEGAGKNGPFAPSSIETETGGHINTDFIMDSEACGRCHVDIYDQWRSSMHHFSSFNNQFYRKAIEYMQGVTGVQSSKWCAGCHDQAVLLNGMMDRPVKEIADTPEGQAGLGCLSCHAITKVKSTMGNADYVIGQSPGQTLVHSKNPIVQKVYDQMTALNPKAHREAYLKPFHRDQSAEFCSSCHKVHLDVPVNGYRWFRGFNEYDNWQGSGISGQGARSFYYPQNSQSCNSCHMPLVASSDPAAKNGFVRSHAFPGANTAVPAVNGDAAQLKLTMDFLKSNRLRVDIFAAAPDVQLPQSVAAASSQATLFASGEEGENPVPRPASSGAGSPVFAPIDRAAPVFARGSEVRVDVVVRTLSVGHFFPAGTVDAFDTWLELKATDSKGKVIFWSGSVEDNGRGPVEEGAHFYRSLQIDGKGNPINKRNAFESRASVYVNLIPPGAADVAHYRIAFDRSVTGPVKLEANLKYRKFSWSYTQFAFEGKTIPDLPIATLANAETTINIGQAPSPSKPAPVLDKKDRERWNDYGIGLFRQGDLKGAQRAFQIVTELDPEYVDGWVNVARVLVEEGEMQAAQTYLERALRLDPDLARARFFRALTLRADGDYDAALADLNVVERQFPRDRVVLNHIGKILFLKREYRRATEYFKRTLAIDPEDLTAHYNLMLAYRGLNDNEAAMAEEKLYMRFKAEESSQALTGEYRRLHPADNNERQPIHMHGSARLPQ